MGDDLRHRILALAVYVNCPGVRVEEAVDRPALPRLLTEELDVPPQCRGNPLCALDGLLICPGFHARLPQAAFYGSYAQHGVHFICCWQHDPAFFLLLYSCFVLCLLDGILILLPGSDLDLTV